MKTLNHIILLIALAFFVSCKDNRVEKQDKGERIACAKLLNIVDGNGYTVVEVSDPWNAGKLLDRYVLVARGSEADSLPEGTKIEVPLTSAIVYSSVHTYGIEAIGADDAVTGVADAQYFSKLPDEKVVDIGSSLSPSIEKVIQLAPQAIILSPYQNSGFGDIARTGISIVQMADYMENTPLGRAEWIKFLGLLFGRENQADSMYEAVCANYEKLRERIAESAKTRPRVLTEELTSGVWYVPGGDSYMAHLLQDAGGDYPWRDDKSTGSLQLNIEAVLAEAGDADVWIVRTYGYDETRDNMLAASEMCRHFKAFKTDGIYGCNTSATNIFDLMAFRPDSVLKEYASILHPALAGSQLRFFKKIK